MATILPADVNGLELGRIFRSPCRYAPEHVTDMLADVVGTPFPAILLDIDALERSALARVDRVMQLALVSLAESRAGILLVARYERARAGMLARAIPRSRVLHGDHEAAVDLARAVVGDAPLVLIGDDPAMFARLGTRDVGLVLGRPELTRENVTVLGDASVRATLWWLYEQRRVALAA